jgi:hypothetical protein
MDQAPLRHLTTLDLSCNDMQCRGMAALATVLSEGTLEVMTIVWCRGVVADETRKQGSRIGWR